MNHPSFKVDLRFTLYNVGVNLIKGVFTHMTKRELMIEFYDLVMKEGTILNERLYKLWQEKRITYGCYRLKVVYDNYDYEELSSIKNIDYVTKWNINYHLDNLKKHISETFEFVNEQEKLEFSKTQMQLLIENKEIRYM